HRLLVGGQREGVTSVFGVDCRGDVAVIAEAVPSFEGGLAVAPEGFGSFAGMLIAPDEQTGQIWAIGVDGRASLLLGTDLPSGGDTGVESVGFIPAGFSGGGFAYLGDRGTADNPFPGTDTVRRLAASTILAAGAREGDLIVSTEGNGLTLAV